ncbi:MAG: asparagine--tRNA ligase [Tissierellia bacterium]|nr:asparagine--tRNA ligase [Tissierellia bacterium]
MDIRDIFKNKESYIGKDITIEGWIKTSRDSKNFAFIELMDGTYFKPIQIVYSRDLENFDEIKRYPIYSSLRVQGQVVESKGAKQAIEIQAQAIEGLFLADGDYPLQKKRHSLEFLRTKAHLRPRANLFQAVFRVRSLLAHGIHSFFQEQGFVYVHTPIITASDAEGAGEMFHVTTLNMKDIPLDEEGKVDYSQDFFGKPTNLTVSGQLQGEAFAHAFKNIYTFGPTFRAEHSNTQRHAAEFWMMEPEMAFADLEDICDNSEALLKYVIQYLFDHAAEELAFFNQFVDKGLMDRLENVLNSDFERITYTKAIDLLKEAKKDFSFPVEWGIDLQTEHERYITEEVYGKPVFITDYPKDIKAFYMRLNEDGKTVAAMDLLVPGIGEIIGGSQREERYDKLVKRMDEMGLKAEDYAWYLDLRRFGSAVHSGYGLGFERAVMYMTGVSNIRDVIPFPRTVGSAEY